MRLAADPAAPAADGALGRRRRARSREFARVDAVRDAPPAPLAPVRVRRDAPPLGRARPRLRGAPPEARGAAAARADRGDSFWEESRVAGRVERGELQRSGGRRRIFFEGEYETAARRSRARARASRARRPSSPSKKSADAAAAPPARSERPSGSPSEAEDPSSDVPRFVGLTPLEIVPEPLATPDPARRVPRRPSRRGTRQLGAVLEDASIRLEGKVVRDRPRPAEHRRPRSASPSRRWRRCSRRPRSPSSGAARRSSSRASLPPAGDLTAAAAAADPTTLEREHLKKKVATDERVKRMMDLFGGEIADVKRDGGPDRAKGR